MKKTITKAIICLALTCVFLSTNTNAQQTDIIGPAGSGSFGQQVVALPNGNIVVVDPNYSIPAGASNVGAVYLYNGSTGALISTLTGSTANDSVGNGGVTVLSNGNYVVRSVSWDGAAIDVGAVTFGNSTTGISGVVSSANSLVGSTASDFVGNNGVTVLSNGNYVVRSVSWDGAAIDVGAVTFGNGTTGVSGVVSSANSLVGSTANDNVGISGVTTLSNGNYVVNNPNWDGTAVNVGAVTFGNGTTGISGVVSSANSLVGSTANDFVGINGVTALTNGNYVVLSSSWDGTATDVGAVTFGNGTIGISGVVSSANSLVGSTSNDNVGIDGVTALSNGNYVVRSGVWDGTAVNVGAVTFGNGTTGVSGVVSSANSLVGSKANDNVGVSGVTALSNGNYVVRSPNWDNGAVINVGAATFGDGTSGISGVVSSSNSLVGPTASDFVGSGGVTALSNGNYVVLSLRWNGTATDVGAVTFGNGTSGTSGVVSLSNSLVGSTAFDNVGINGVTALTNGNYVVLSSSWDGTATDVGAVTFGNGTTGVSGVVSSANSLVGSTANDNVGNNGVTALSNGNYVVRTASWDNGAVINVGAVTFGNGTSGTSGVVSTSNSLVGSTTSDSVGNGGVTALTNGNYVVSSRNWDNGAVIDAGAVTFGNGTSGTSGVVSTSNSLVGSTAGDGVGNGGVTAFVGGNYVVHSPNFDNGASDIGAITYLSGLTGNFAPFNEKADISKQDDSKQPTPPSDDLTVSMTNSVLGTAANGGSSMNFTYDLANDQLVVGRPADNIVTLFKRFGPTAASLAVSGKVQSQTGSGISRAQVSITDSEGQIRTSTTNQFGYFIFENVAAGQVYVFSVRSKEYSFVPQIVNISEDVRDLILTAQ